MKPLDKSTLIELVIGMIGLVVVMWLVLKHMTGPAWYPWIDPVIVILLAIMVLTGAVAILSTPRTRE